MKQSLLLFGTILTSVMTLSAQSVDILSQQISSSRQADNFVVDINVGYAIKEVPASYSIAVTPVLISGTNQAALPAYIINGSVKHRIYARQAVLNALHGTTSQYESEYVFSGKDKQTLVHQTPQVTYHPWMDCADVYFRYEVMDNGNNIVLSHTAMAAVGPLMTTKDKKLVAAAPGVELPAALTAPVPAVTAVTPVSEAPAAAQQAPEVAPLTPPVTEEAPIVRPLTQQDEATAATKPAAATTTPAAATTPAATTTPAAAAQPQKLTFKGAYIVPASDAYDKKSKELYNLSLEEARVIADVNPQMLSLLELFNVAESYRDDAKKFYSLMELSVRLFPADPIANINAAAAAIDQGNAQLAAKYLQQAAHDTEAYDNNHGACELMVGNISEGIMMLKRAEAKGCQEAEQNLTAFFTYHHR